MTPNEREAINNEVIEALRKRKDETEKAERAQKPAPFVQHGWLCPACGRGNAPMNMTCPCKPWPTMGVTC
jgi:hypothetical protein